MRTLTLRIRAPLTLAALLSTPLAFAQAPAAPIPATGPAPTPATAPAPQTEAAAAPQPEAAAPQPAPAPQTEAAAPKAETAEPKKDDKPAETAKPAGGKVEKRKKPDYDGVDEPTTAGDVAIWVPRLVLSPLYLVSEFVIRRPLGALITAAERANLPKVLYDFFTFGPDHKAGFAPVAFFDFGFRPSVGLYVFWDDAFFKGNDIRLHGSFWGTDWLAGVVTDRVRLGEESTLSFDFSAIKRPDHVFYGIGPNTRQDDESRYGRTLFDGSATYQLGLWRSSSISTRVGVKRAMFRPGHYGDDPSIVEESNKGTFPLPDGYATGYTAAYEHALAAFDTRRPRPADGSGFRVEAEGEHGTQLDELPGSAWLRYGFSAGFFYDLNDHNRVISLSATTLFSDPVGRGPVPFTELVQLGGYGPMRGFWPGRLIDRSAAVLTARYKWPIWVWLDGTIEASVGNVFGEHLSGFDTKLLRFSSAIGMSTVGSPDSSLELLFGIGSETFDSGGKIDSFRLLVGTNRGF